MSLVFAEGCALNPRQCLDAAIFQSRRCHHRTKGLEEAKLTTQALLKAVLGVHPVPPVLS